MKRFVLVLALASSIHSACHSQGTVVKLNQEIMDLSLPGLIPHVKQTSIRELRGQFLILDFFSSTCSVCFRSFPKINELQKKFNGKMKFILIGKKDNKIESIYRTFEQRLNLNLLVVFDSTIPRRLNINSFPSYCWIDDSGILKAITGPEELNEQNIQAFISGKNIKLFARAESGHFDFKGYFLVNGNGGADTSFDFRSVFAKWDPMRGGSTPPAIDWTEHPGSFNALGKSLTALYNYAYFGRPAIAFGDSDYEKIYPFPILETKDSSRFVVTGTSYENLFCYSLTVPFNRWKRENLEKIMQRDMENYFGFQVSVEERKLPCWVLRVDSNQVSALKTKGGIPTLTVSYAGFSCNNQPVSKLLSEMATYIWDSPPFVNETELDFNIDLKLKAVMTDVYDIQPALAEKGLILKKELRPVKVLVVKDPG